LGFAELAGVRLQSLAGGVEVDDWAEFVTPDMLTQRIELDQYITKQLAPLLRHVPQGVSVRELIASKKTPLEALMQPGDEWWQWVSGTEPLMQLGGLALVRAGAIVWARLDWIS
jgi:hypothetical protein